MAKGQYFSFDHRDFRRVVAHGGTGLIKTERVLAGPPDTACDFVDLTVVPPDSTIGVHTHGPIDEEFYVVISGTGEMHLDGQTFPVGPGDVIRNRPGGTHGLRNTGAEEIRIVVMQVPTREAVVAVGGSSGRRD
jgi:mannose-6-phosphate isomerase-like protein (cupin superfamily)